MRRPGRVTIAALMSVSLLKASMGVAHAGDIPAQPTAKKPVAKAPTSKGTTAKASSSKKSKVSKLNWAILFAVTADEAMITPLGGKNYQLTLENVDERTTWFTDRPVRHAGATPTARLIAGWNIGRDSFAQDPPNAALVVHEPDGGADTIVVELSNPIYDQVNDQLSFTGKELAAEAELNTAHRADVDPLPKVPTTYSAVSLFIDDASTILVAPAPTSTASATPSPTPSAGATPTASPTPSSSATASASPTPSATSSGSTSAAAAGSPSPTPASTSSSPTSSSSSNSPNGFINFSVPDWQYHLVITSNQNDANTKYLAKSKLNNDLITTSGDYIYSFPASYLVSNFSVHHLDAIENNGGVNLAAHSRVDNVIIG